MTFLVQFCEYMCLTIRCGNDSNGGNDKTEEHTETHLRRTGKDQAKEIRRLKYLYWTTLQGWKVKYEKLFFTSYAHGSSN